ncbi:hypothetical protein SLEP1_g1102 [Rubroshorea leprosula]|uniref:KIB1-4 beta-propeller domain-containing protein n=1 Tax=Rubroshorea leprosula TaxID=152421 RepID=A0AAV5HIG3_9ROSI|nr:hypothetical protein SLEP1_g1102 [Rubroshorea leprosula]
MVGPSSRMRKHRYSLWNPMTDVSIHLPPLSLKPHQKILNCILSSPPGSRDSMLILFETKTPSFIFCRIGDDEKWKKQQIDDYFRKFYIDVMDSVICNGRLILIATCCRELVAFDIMPDHLALIGEVEGNHVYYESRYSFNMEDKTTSVSSPYSNLRESLYQDTAFYIMPDPDNRVSNYVDRHIKDNLNDGSKEIKPEIGEIVNDTVNDQEEDGAGDQFSPPIQSLEVSLSPWLTFWENGDSTGNFFDPIRSEKYFMNIPKNQFEYVELYYSGEGWCVMLQEEQSIFLWNPFAQKTIPLPNIPHDRSIVSGCGFSTSPDSSDCVIALLSDLVTECYIDFISLKDEEWRSFYLFDRQESELEMDFDRNMAFYNGDFYFLGTAGKLVAVRMKEEFCWESLDKPECPTDSFHQNYLLNCDGKLLSIFVASFGKWVRIFSLDDSEMAWVEVENLGNHTLYVSHLSSFSTCATPGMENRVYFPHYHGQSAVYYSLDSRKFHCQGSEHVLKDLSVTREQLLCGWVEPKF